MRINILIVIILVLICLGTDYYVWRFLSKRFKKRWPSRVQLVSAVALYAVAAVGMFLPWKSGGESNLIATTWLFFIFMTFLGAKLLFVIFDLLARIPLLFKHKGWHKLRWLSITGAVLGGLLFVMMWWGALINRYRIQVVEEQIAVASLPASFDGLRVVQLSDMHVGTYGSDTAFVSRLVDRVNALSPDVVFFTGDIVNRRSSELLPFVDVLSRLKAPMGVYAILGNHDYGDYTEWKSDAEKQQNMQQLYDCYSRIGWKLLLNETAYLVRGTDSLAVIGVENIGDPPFPVYGDLRKAYPTPGDSLPKILLSHNPAHWCSEIRDDSSMNIGLTLSGHTHAMQIELFGLSPAVFRYPTWGGLYYPDGTKARPLYVNIGTGTVGLPARVGATPEITVFTLRSK